MKITFISQYFHPEPFSNNEIAQALVEKGHDLDVICCVPNYPSGVFTEGYDNKTRRFEIWKGIRIWRVFTIARGTSALRLILNYVTFPITAGLEMRRRLKTRPDVSFVSLLSPVFQAIVGLTLRRRHGTPCVYWVQDIWPESPIIALGLRNPLIIKPLTALCGYLYRKADLILVQSAAFPQMIERFGVPAERIRVLPNTAPPIYHPMASQEAPIQADMIAKARQKPKDFVVMFAGNIGDSQDFDTLIAAAELLKETDITWAIIGSGRALERSQAKVRNAGLEGVFKFLGRHPEDMMPGFFAQADAMLVSLLDTPIFALTVPYKVQCYMACAKPIVASLSGEGARIIEQARAGIAAPPSEPRALADAILELRNLPEDERAQLGKNARDYFKANYSPDIVYGNLEAWLSEVAQAHIEAKQVA